MSRPVRLLALGLLVALPGCALIRLPFKAVDAVGTAAIKAVTRGAADPVELAPRTRH